MPAETSVLTCCVTSNEKCTLSEPRLSKGASPGAPSEHSRCNCYQDERIAGPWRPAGPAPAVTQFVSYNLSPQHGPVISVRGGWIRSWAGACDASPSTPGFWPLHCGKVWSGRGSGGDLTLSLATLFIHLPRRWLDWEAGELSGGWSRWRAGRPEQVSHPLWACFLAWRPGP